MYNGIQADVPVQTWFSLWLGAALGVAAELMLKVGLRVG